MTDTEVDGSSGAAMRCSAWSRFAGLDPIGTTGSHGGYLLADLDLPWPSDLARLDHGAALQRALAGSGIRLQATVPTGEHRVVLYRRAGDGSTGSGTSPDLLRSETAVGPGPAGLVSAVERLLDAEPLHAPRGRREVLVCTHGSRDVCCGALGTRLQLDLAAQPDLLGEDVAVRRTSHTGGHRFAPTAIVLPDATGWAYVDAEVLRSIVTRTGPVSAVLGHYRGWAGLGSPQLQALERAVLAEVGWGLLDRRRWGEDLGDGAVRLHVEPGGGGPEAGTVTWEATVVAARRIPRPECGHPVGAGAKADTEMVVTNLTRSHPGAA